MRKILCAMDMTQRSEYAVERAALLAQRIEAELLSMTSRNGSNRIWSRVNNAWVAEDLLPPAC